MQTATFPHEAYRRIEVTYTVTNDGPQGTVYFAADDLAADMVNGEFTHPMTGLLFRFFAAGPWKSFPECSLEIQTWRTIGRATPQESFSVATH